MSAARFRLTAQDGRLVSCAAPVPGGHAHRAEGARRRSSPPHVACSPLTTAPDVTEKDIAHTAFSHPPFSGASHCFAPHRSLLRRRCPSPMSRPELSASTKRSASSPRPSCTKSLPTAPASKAGPRDFPTVIFLHEHLTAGSLLHLFPTPLTPQQASYRRGARSRSLLRPPRSLPQPLTGISSPSAHTPL
jgi:hypothetical protein